MQRERRVLRPSGCGIHAGQRRRQFAGAAASGFTPRHSPCSSAPGSLRLWPGSSLPEAPEGPITGCCALQPLPVPAHPHCRSAGPLLLLPLPATLCQVITSIVAFSTVVEYDGSSKVKFMVSQQPAPDPATARLALPHRS